MFVYKKENLMPIKTWMNQEKFYEDQKMVEQIENVASLPFIFDHVSLMPDGHAGYGCPIGSVVATRDYIVPFLVGVDIGCGMCATKTNYNGPLGTEILKKIMGVIRHVVPVGMGCRSKEACDYSELPQLPYSLFLKEYLHDARYQLGTLGSGNHFIEIQRDQEDFIWIMIHSGSRNLGKSICDYYNKLAEDACNLWKAQYPEELAWLPLSSPEGSNYWIDMEYATDFALKNRMKMMYRIMEGLRNTAEKYAGIDISFPNEIINIHHNYASKENHFNENVIIHRKGATSAKKDELGIIPGSQGSSSYIVKGRGNPDSFMSCSHGAGRKMGRKEAQRSLNLADEIKKLDDQGIVHGIRNANDLDEATGAYKDIDVVMKEQEDLVDIVYKLRPVAVIKG